MDSVNNHPVENNTNPSQSMDIASKIRINKKWIFIAVGVILIFITALIFLIAGSSSKKDNEPSLSPIPTQVKIVPTSVFTPEQQKAIQEQQKADEVVREREIEIKTKYPWFIKLPLRGEKYFVYFDTNKKTFVGLLYPKSTDSTQIMKQEIILKLKNNIGITDVDTYQFEWKITPE